MSRPKDRGPGGGLGFAGSRGRNAAPKWAPSTHHNRNDNQAINHLGFVINQINVEVPINDDVSSCNGGLLSVHCGSDDPVVMRGARCSHRTLRVVRRHQCRDISSISTMGLQFSTTSGWISLTLS